VRYFSWNASPPDYNYAVRTSPTPISAPRYKSH